jgi:hypothetical protein
MPELKHDAPRRSLPNYSYRLSWRHQRCYLNSESIERFEGFAPSAATSARLQELRSLLYRVELFGQYTPWRMSTIA